MLKSHLLFLLLFLKASSPVLAQCLTAPPAPDCTGSEPSLVNNETLNVGTTKWYYGPTATFNSITLAGGTLVVCTDLTIDQFYMTSGTIFVRPGAKLVIGSGSGAGLTLNGNCEIYNYGTMDVQRNLSLDAGATESSPNIIINAIPAATFRVPYQYFVINNKHSWFVNNGTAEFGGLITDTYAAESSVCMGSGSVIKMSTLINKVADTYKVNWGNACVYVSQTSIFNDKLTSSPNLYACLSSSHSSYSGCGGCPANNWGSANSITGCSSCVALNVLGNQSIDLSVATHASTNELRWTISGAVTPGKFSIERSSDAIHYQTITTVDLPENTNSQTTFNYLDKAPMSGSNYYMVKYLNADKATINSKVVRVSSAPPNTITISPMPFTRNFTVTLSKEIQPEKLIITDIAGKNIRIKYDIDPISNRVNVELLEDVASGVYVLHLKSQNATMARTIFKQ